MADRYHLKPVAELLRDNCDIDPHGCWLWKGRLYPNGYGQFHVRRKVVYAHIASYEIAKGKVASGFELDHTCRNRSCVNPDHLEPVTHLENVRRGSAVRMACGAGHEYTEENTYRDRNGWAHCRICARNLKRQRWRIANPNAPVGNRYKTHCKHGHIFDDQNTITLSSGKRVCRECNRKSCQIQSAKRMGKKNAVA